MTDLSTVKNETWGPTHSYSIPTATIQASATGRKSQSKSPPIRSRKTRESGSPSPRWHCREAFLTRAAAWTFGARSKSAEKCLRGRQVVPEEEADTGYSATLNKPYEYTLSAGDKIILKTVNFYDNDDTGTDDGIPDAGDDLFTDKSKEFEFQVDAATGMLESLGDAETGSVKLQVSYKVEIVGM